MSSLFVKGAFFLVPFTLRTHENVELCIGSESSKHCVSEEEAEEDIN